MKSELFEGKIFEKWDGFSRYGMGGILRGEMGVGVAVPLLPRRGRRAGRRGMKASGGRVEEDLAPGATRDDREASEGLRDDDVVGKEVLGIA